MAKLTGDSTGRNARLKCRPQGRIYEFFDGGWGGGSEQEFFKGGLGSKSAGISYTDKQKKINLGG